MINKSTNIAEIIKKNPKSKEILLKFGLGCATCGLGSIETIEEGAKAHGLSEKEVDELVNKLSQI
jgi:hybrid cluster-associated redox disulfide protein